jgi:hypothetical protein
MKKDKMITLVKIDYLDLKRKLLQLELKTRKLINKNQKVVDQSFLSLL